MMRTFLSWVGLWLAAALTTAALGSLVQSWHNMSAIAALGVPVTAGERLAAMGADLITFGPVWAILVALALLPALPIAGLITRRLASLSDPIRRQTFYGLAAFIAVLALLLIINTLAPMTPIAATRSASGLLGMALPALAGGWLFARYSGGKH
ncbi:hypothetical protein [Natronospira bacteriovora]|uniref:Uncharacterized protein n=1 Tax=Natronospira bacteriovora TaxID=3069753 RepID=A0ABU0W4Z3_9GAMM|nr:hypothetical protein [Natronospira sp. AB-CW4]MDQ2068833.1 hypothetical protein [Natronospira sp. AB-CW4]